MSDIADVASLYADRIPADRLISTLHKDRTAHPSTSWWATPDRPHTSRMREIMEVRFNGPRLINYLTFEVMHFPHSAEVERFDPETEKWVKIAHHDVTFSRPQRITQVVGSTTMEPIWKSVSMRLTRFRTDRVRIVMRRHSQDPPMGSNGRPIDYPLGVRNFDIGYRVTAHSDVPVEAQGDVFASSMDLLGSRVSYSMFEQHASGLPDGTEWRCEPQPINYSVVNFYLDTSTAESLGKTIDRFFIDPTHGGPTFSLYHSDDPASWEEKVWELIPRDYQLQKGFIHLPPTRARFWKFEFTNLVAEPYESFLPINRKVLLFPPDVLMRYHLTHNPIGESTQTGIKTEMELVQQYRNTIETLTQRRSFNERPSPTETLYVPDPAGSKAVREQSWVYGFEPWHMDRIPPRFIEPQRHRYREVEIRHVTKVGFFVGLKRLEAYRVNYAVEDDTEVYVEHFHDETNLTSSTWRKGVNFLTSGAGGVTAESNILRSASEVVGVQFATTQTPPPQVAPDDDFRDPMLGSGSYDWNSQGLWHKVGDANPEYLRSVHSIKVTRNEGTFGGIESPLIQPSDSGRLYVAARVKLEQDLSAPLFIQVIGHDGTLLTEQAITGMAGQTLEWYVGHTIGSVTLRSPSVSGIAAPLSKIIPTGNEFQTNTNPLDTHVRIRVIQKGLYSDIFTLDTLSLFDEGILWEWSVDGGTTWIPALDARNNVNGVVTFPQPGKELRWRVHGLRPDLNVTSLKIRPWYRGRHTGAPARPQRGPNVSTWDHTPPIWDDAEFTEWPSPIPRHWYAGWRLEPEQGFGYSRVRVGDDETGPAIDSADRTGGIFSRTSSDTTPVADTADKEQSKTTIVQEVVKPPGHKEQP